MAIQNHLRRLFIGAVLLFEIASVSSFILVPIHAPGTFLSTEGLKQDVLQELPRHRGGLAAKKKNNYGDEKALKEFCAEQEARAIAASESWIVEATEFLEPEQSSALMDVLQDRADVDCLSVGSYRGTDGRRVRCVFSTPDLGYNDDSTANEDYVCYLKVDNVALSQCDPWPNILVKIGLSLETVGDVFVVDSESTVYLAVTRESEKTCTRLLPKELPGTGVTVTKLSWEDMNAEIATISDGKIVEDMEVQRADKRKQ